MWSKWILFLNKSPSYTKSDFVYTTMTHIQNLILGITDLAILNTWSQANDAKYRVFDMSLCLNKNLFLVLKFVLKNINFQNILSIGMYIKNNSTKFLKIFLISYLFLFSSLSYCQKFTVKSLLCFVRFWILSNSARWLF